MGFGDQKPKKVAIGVNPLFLFMLGRVGLTISFPYIIVKP
jgi:hypothetical protein